MGNEYYRLLKERVNYITESKNVDSEYVEEFFKFKKGKKKDNDNDKKEERKESKKEYDVNKVKTDIAKIKAEVKKMFSDEKLKKYYNNGLEIASNSTTYDYVKPTEKDNGEKVYVSGNIFAITSMDLWDYKGGNPRTIIDENNGDHPVYDADNLIREKLEEFLKNKMPDYEVDEYGGDWDTSFMDVKLK